jgi:hypothetical protein
MVIRPKHVADGLNTIINNYWNNVVLEGNPWNWSNTRSRMQKPKFKKSVNFQWIYFLLKMVVRPKHVADNLNDILNNYWNRFPLDGNPWTWSNTRSRMQTPKFKKSVNFRWIYFLLKMVVWPKHVADNLNETVNNYWNRVALDGTPWTWNANSLSISCFRFHP